MPSIICSISIVVSDMSDCVINNVFFFNKSAIIFKEQIHTIELKDNGNIINKQPFFHLLNGLFFLFESFGRILYVPNMQNWYKAKTGTTKKCRERCKIKFFDYKIGSKSLNDLYIVKLYLNKKLIKSIISDKKYINLINIIIIIYFIIFSNQVKIF